MTLTLFFLLVAFQLKHLFADYFLQTPYMLGKFKPGWDFVGPLSAHCGVHALGTLIVTCGLWPFELWKLPVILTLDFVVHFTMDRIKASPKYLGRYVALTKAQFPTATPEQLRSNERFWWALGFDQFVHHITHYVIIWIILQ